VRVQVSATEWKTASLEVHMNIRALLVKTFARETSEVRGGFEPVPVGMTLEQGMAVLGPPGTLALNGSNVGETCGTDGRNGAIAATAMRGQPH
jgi:hypothetical protein